MMRESWNYFAVDKDYSDLLKKRLSESVVMDSAIALAKYLNECCEGNLRICDLGSGPGHYYPVISEFYKRGQVHYCGVDFDKENIAYGAEYFRENPNVEMVVGDVLRLEEIDREFDCIVSANTLPHIPSVEPITDYLIGKKSIKYFLFRMLIGSECIQIKKHLRENEFQDMFCQNFQFNNIYSAEYLMYKLGSDWELSILPDVYDNNRLDSHSGDFSFGDNFYKNRVSRNVNGMVFKGDIYMPWKFVFGKRRA